MEPELVGSKLCVGGYMYVKNKVYKKKTVYWECELLRSQTCDARAITQVTSSSGLKLIKGPVQEPHDHPPNADAAEAGRVRLRLKRKATEEPDAPLPKSSVMGSLMYPPECSPTYPNERISRNACGGNEGLPFQPTPSHSPSSSHCRRNIKKPWQVSHSYSTILALTRHLLQQVVFLSSLPEKT